MIALSAAVRTFCFASASAVSRSTRAVMACIAASASAVALLTCYLQPARNEKPRAIESGIELPEKDSEGLSDKPTLTFRDCFDE